MRHSSVTYLSVQTESKPDSRKPISSPEKAFVFFVFTSLAGHVATIAQPSKCHIVLNKIDSTMFKQKQGAYPAGRSLEKGNAVEYNLLRGRRQKYLGPESELSKVVQWGQWVGRSAFPSLSDEGVDDA